MKQLLLFPDPRPLTERLGADFFRQAPECAGVYLMRDAADMVLYVGKAKNLRKRLGSYRVANPDRMARRHLRMLRAVVRIELRECADEAAALATESELLLALRPKFNRAGTWPSAGRHLAWRCEGRRLELAVFETPEDGWSTHGPVGGARYLRGTLARLIWLATHDGSAAKIPAGWLRSDSKMANCIHCGELLEVAVSHLEHLLVGRPEKFLDWIKVQCAGRDAFTTGLIAEDLESLENLFVESAEDLLAPQDLVSK